MLLWKFILFVVRLCSPPFHSEKQLMPYIFCILHESLASCMPLWVGVFGFMTWTISGLSCLWSVSWTILLLFWSISLAYDLCCQELSCHVAAAEHLMTYFCQAHSWSVLLQLQQLCNIVELHYNIYKWSRYLHHWTIDCSPSFFVWFACELMLLYV